ncbi:DUF4135 domain-containing protein [Streptomyces otsuchiensis]|uniref:DUF4135 domain-containing protein n=1 Tax=Streptomyces otsuchiensis TaxID=2681388 RepID=UPI001030417F|nr:DUF4135 domain-containing protein [Streptomyces otsuchiensis]
MNNAPHPPLLRLPDAPATAPRQTTPAGAAPGRVSALRRLTELVRTSGAPGAIPPVLTSGPGGMLVHERELTGPDEAAGIGLLLAGERFAPLRAAIDRFDGYCARTAPRHSAVLAPHVLDVTDTGLFGAVTGEIFAACAAGDPGTAARYAEHRAAQYLAFLDLFLDRLGRDLGAPGWPSGARWQGPVTSLWANGEETHNGGQRVLRVGLAGGGHAAYKPRPATGEELLVGEDGSLFALLTSLPPASGPVRLPTLRVWHGTGDASGHSWQEWIDPPAQQGTLREENGWRLTGTVLEPADARRFWHRAGAFAATAFGLGIADLNGDNVLAGARPGDEPLLYAVDTEAYLAGLGGLTATGLLPDAADDAWHHVGLETDARWCAPTGPVLYWLRADDGGLELHRRRGAVARTSTRSVVGDTTGRTGYAGYLPALLRGMFDGWTHLVRHRDAVREFIADRAAGQYVRVIPRRTAHYAGALDAWLWPSEAPGVPPAAAPGAPDRAQAPSAAPGPSGTSGGSPVFGPDELRQLLRGDVPYFFRSADGGPLLAMEPPPASFDVRPADVDSPFASVLPPVASVAGGDRLTLAGLGIALRDAVEHVRHQLPHLDGHTVIEELGHGVRLELRGPQHGQVAFDWPAAGRRITYQWEPNRLRLRLDTLSRPTEEVATP